MATQAEIQQQYDNDKSQKILQLQTTFVGRTVQSAKQAGLLKNNVSVISTTVTADDFAPKLNPSILGKSDTENRNFILSTIRDGMIEKFSTNDSVFSYVILECICSITSIDSSKITLNYSIIERLYLKEQNSVTANEIFTGGGGVVKIELPNNSNAFSQLRKELSAFAYPVANITSNGRFDTYLQFVNTKLKVESIPQLDSLALAGFAVFSLGDYNGIFPKPDGLIETPTITTPTDTGVVVPSVPTDSVDVTGDSNLGSVTSPISTTPSTPTTPTSTGGIKYLSIEAVKDDDPGIRSETVPTAPIRYISVRAVTDEEVEASFRSGGLNAITTEQTAIRNTENPLKPTDGVNTVVAENEREEIERRTLAQIKAEEADALAKAQAKEKALSGPVGPNPDLKNGEIVAAGDKKDEPTSTPDNPIIQQNPNAVAKYFLEWHKTDGADENGIIYRGNSDAKPSNESNLLNKLVEKRYKNLFNFGKDLEKMFSGIKLESPIDIGLALNGIQVGLFNKNIPYMFGEGSEVHAAMILASTDNTIVQREDGGRGTYSNNANWGNEPFWCGYFTDFVLHTNTFYRSDNDRKSIIGTSSVYGKSGYYDKSPFNRIQNVDDSDIQTYQKNIRDYNKQLRARNKELNAKKAEEKANQKKLESAKKNKNSKPASLKKLEIQLQKTKGEIQAIQKNIASLDAVKKSNETALAAKTNINQNTLYNESNIVAVFYRGYHIAGDNSLTARGKELLQKIKSWPGGYIVTDTGHVEVLLHISPSGIIYSLGGNTGVTLRSYKGGDSVDVIKQRANPAPQKPDDTRNGYQYGFKISSSFGAWGGGGGNLYIVKRGTKIPYTKGIGVGVIKTETWKQYEEVVKSNNDITVSPMAYNLLHKIFV
jgi:hypothetical protein